MGSLAKKLSVTSIHDLRAGAKRPQTRVTNR
jgi:hypothetical protein